MEQFTHTKDQFLINIAHELQGPLASWRSSVEILLEDYPVLNQRELGIMLKGLERSATRFEGLVEFLIDIGKLEAGRLRIHPTSVQINSVIEDGVAQVGSLLLSKSQSPRLS